MTLRQLEVFLAVARAELSAGRGGASPEPAGPLAARPGARGRLGRPSSIDSAAVSN